jgi:beta-phosphoglucomutase
MPDTFAVIFDMDGVLIDTYHAHFQSWLMVAEREGLHFTEAEFAPTFGRTSREIIPYFWGEGRLNNEQIAAIDDAKEAFFREIISKDFSAMPGVKELLAELHRDGFKLAIGSSAPRESVEMVIDRLDAGRWFEASVSGKDVVHGKPNPQVFLLAAERLGVAPSRCAVVEDAPPGIEAAHAAGMKAVGLVSTGRTREELSRVDLLVAKLDELSPKVFRALISDD